MKNFLNTLFSSNEFVCSADNKYENTVNPLEEVSNDQCYITLNPIRRECTRSDSGVSVFRNILVEFDHIVPDQQLSFVEEIGMPFTTCVFSGNKSYHFVISLEEPLESMAEYRRIVRWLYEAVPEADKSCKNPSRFTRLGGGRHSNGNEQTIAVIKERVPNKVLMAWLENRCEEPVEVDSEIKQLADEEFLEVQASGYRAKLHKATVEFCKTGGRKGHRHKNIFIAACNLRDCYYTLQEAKFLLLNKLGALYKEQGRDYEIALKERAVEDAYLLPPRKQNRG